MLGLYANKQNDVDARPDGESSTPHLPDLTVEEEEELHNEIAASLTEAVECEITGERIDEDLDEGADGASGDPPADFTLDELAEEKELDAVPYSFFAHPDHDVVAIWVQKIYQMKVGLVEERDVVAGTVNVALLCLARQDTSAWRRDASAPVMKATHAGNIYGGVQAVPHGGLKWAKRDGTHYDVPPQLLVEAEELNESMTVSALKERLALPSTSERLDLAHRRHPAAQGVFGRRPRSISRRKPWVAAGELLN